MQLTIFYDSQCPLCLAEMQQLKGYDDLGRLNFVNLNTDNFSQRYPHIDPVRANRILHGQLETGEILLGLDVTYRAWSLVGKHKWLALLRWPIIRHLADGFYLLFARYRYGISYLLTGQSRCTGICALDNPKP
jgi:predicted DCC family thiol-disulfide oxidoreductase YuxK